MKIKLNVLQRFRLDDYTTFYIGVRNGFKNSIFIEIDGIREHPLGQKIDEANIQIYTREDLKKYYSVNRGDFQLDVTGRYIVDTYRKWIFIPLSNRAQNIVDYGIASLRAYDILKNLFPFRYRRANQKYIHCGGYNLHEILFGRKAKAGGWEKIENYVETEESLAATWIISDEMPLPHIGRNWNHCKDKHGNVYVKIPAHTIDHSNGNGLDDRDENLREALFNLNGANRSKLKGKTSAYFGVHRMFDKWVSSIIKDGQQYLRRFLVEIEAAKFHDMYALALYKKVICNNGLLTESETADILKRGEEAIPAEFRAIRKKERILPKYIMMDREKFKVCKRYMGQIYSQRYNTLEEAIASLPLLEATIQDAKQRYQAYLVKVEREKIKGDMWLLSSNDKYGNINGYARVDPEIWEKFIHTNWVLSSNDRLQGTINGLSNEIHVQVFREVNPEYHKSVHGTVDHRVGDYINDDGIPVSDCRMANLRCATFSQQCQNRILKATTLPYKGISISNGKFFAVFGWDRKTRYGKRHVYIEDAARDYNKFALEKWTDATLNVVTDTKTSVEYFYHKSVLTMDKIVNFASMREIKTVLYVNQDWADACGIVSLTHLNRSMFKKYQDMLKKLFLNEEIVRDEDDDSEDEGALDEDDVEDDELEDEDDQIDEDEEDEEVENDETAEIVNSDKPEAVKYKRRQYIDMPVDPETDASKIGNWVYGYAKGFDRSKLIIKEEEAVIIRMIFEELNKKTKKTVISKKINDMGIKKNGNSWTRRMVDDVHSHQEKYEGKLQNGFRHPKII